MNIIDFPEKKRYERLVAAVAGRAQKDFKRVYLDRAGDARRMKTTKDASWIKHHGTDQVNIAALDFRALPVDWQSERKMSAQIATDAVLDAVKNGKVLDKKFIEEVAHLLHEKWLERNHARATKVELHSYPELPENEKEKDRFFARAAVELCVKSGGSTPRPIDQKTSDRGNENLAWKQKSRK